MSLSFDKAIVTRAETDPSEKLEAGQIFIKSSKSILNGEGCEAVVLEGDVLVCLALMSLHGSILSRFQVTRHPCKLPTDVRKVCPCE